MIETFISNAFREIACQGHGRLRYVMLNQLRIAAAHTAMIESAAARHARSCKKFL